MSIGSHVLNMTNEPYMETLSAMLGFHCLLVHAIGIGAGAADQRVLDQYTLYSEQLTTPTQSNTFLSMFLHLQNRILSE